MSIVSNHSKQPLKPFSNSCASKFFPMKTILFVLGSLGPHSRSGEPWNISWTPCYTTKRWSLNIQYQHKNHWLKLLGTIFLTPLSATSPTHNLTWKKNIKRLEMINKIQYIKKMTMYISSKFLSPHLNWTVPR